MESKILKHLITTLINKKFRNPEKQRKYLIDCIESSGYILEKNVKSPKKCKKCDNEVSKKNKFCNRSCYDSYIKTISDKKIENGDTSLGDRRYKCYLIKKYGEKCMDCGWCEKNKKTGNIPIQLEHIDGHSENNSLDNLKLLCPNCHSLTPTYGSLNKGNGRKKRYKYKDSSE